MQRGRGQRETLLLTAAHGAGALRTQSFEVVGGALFGDARFDVAFEPVEIGMKRRFSSVVRSSHSENFCGM